MATQDSNFDAKVIPHGPAVALSQTESRQVARHSPEETPHWESKTLEIIDAIRQPLTMDELFDFITTEVGGLLQAYRCFIVQCEDNSGGVITHEYRSHADVKPMLHRRPPNGFCPHLERCRRNEFSSAQDAWSDESIDRGEIWFDFLKEYDIRGVIGVPVNYQGEHLCTLFIHTDSPRVWTEREFNFIRFIANQIAINIYQERTIELLEQAHKARREAEKLKEEYLQKYEWEKKSREVLQTIRQSIDTDKVFPVAIEEIARALDADRAFIIEFDGEKVCPVRYEYRSHEAVKPFTGIVPPWDFCPYLAISARNEMAWSADCYNDTNVESNEHWYRFSRYYDIRSIIAVPILYNGKLMNVIVFHTLEPRAWSDQELFFVKIAAEQLSTLFYQEKVREELIRAAQIKSDFLSKMSHELRTPLNSIMGYSKMVEKGMAGPLNAKQIEYMGYVGSSAKHLLNLVNDLLDFSKIEAGKMTLSCQPVDLYALIDDVKAMMDGLAYKKNIMLSFQVQPDLEMIHADPARLKQILINLLNNAIKFNHSNGLVLVRLNKSEDGAWLIGEVQDTGIGIEKHKLAELFNKFHQVDNSASRKHEGTGLGLVLTKELLELHGGEISVDSEEGIGTTFAFRLPMQVRVTSENPQLV
jgi:signal transduction histidine kinase